MATAPEGRLAMDADRAQDARRAAEGDGFDDAAYGNDTTTGELAILQIAHASGWRFGTNFFFLDVLVWGW